jgi:HSP20 family molecular chaperone IbpA
MSLIQHSMLPRSMFDMDSWLDQTLDVFDPFDELDYLMGRNFNWLKRPQEFEELAPKVIRKYRITVDCAGYKPKSIKTEFKDNRLIVSGKEDFEDENGDFTTKEFRKSFDVPENAEKDKLASFMTGKGTLVVEIPLLAEKEATEEDLFPKIIEKKDGSKQVSVDCALPKGIDPSKLTVTCKDRDLIIKAEDVKEKSDSKSKMHYYKRCRLPENTDFESIKCHLDKNKLSIQAAISEKADAERLIPIEQKKRRKI